MKNKFVEGVYSEYIQKAYDRHMKAFEDKASEITTREIIINAESTAPTSRDYLLIMQKNKHIEITNKKNNIVYYRLTAYGHRYIVCGYCDHRPRQKSFSSFLQRRQHLG